jgi:DNA-binding CsgD family transcriptional regulator
LPGIYNEKRIIMDATPLQIVASFYEASLDETVWPEALAKLREAVDADAAALVVHDFEAGLGRIVAASGLKADVISSYGRRYSRFNVWMQREALFSTPATVIEGHAIVSLAAVRDSLFYREWLQPAEVFEHAFLLLCRSGQLATVISLSRREGRGPFPRTAIERLQEVAPDLARGFAAGRQARRLDGFRRAATEVLDTLPFGLILLNGNGAVISANRISRRLLDLGHPLFLESSGLAVEINGRHLRLRDLLSQITADGNTSEPYAFSIPRQNLRPLTLLASVCRAPGEPLDDDVPAAILYIGDPEQAPLVDHTRVARLYGLSRAESRVAALLASGYRLDQAAEVLGVAYETVRKHLKQIFGKTGTVRQAELVRMLVTGPAGLSL